MKTFTKSLSIDVTGVEVEPKQFKIITDAIRSAVKNEHGFKAQKGLTDTNLRSSAVIIRFQTAESRDDFNANLKTVLSQQVIGQTKVKYLAPKHPSSTLAPVKLVACQ